MLLYMTGGFRLSEGSMLALTSVLRTSVAARGVGGPLVGLGDGLLGGPSVFSNSACMGNQKRCQNTSSAEVKTWRRQNKGQASSNMGVLYTLCMSASS